MLPSESAIDNAARRNVTNGRGDLLASGGLDKGQAQKRQEVVNDRVRTYGPFSGSNGRVDSRPCSGCRTPSEA